MEKNPKEEARKLREAGYSLNYICRKLKTPKSTVWYWISHVPLTPQQQKELDIKRAEARKLGHLACINKRLATIERYKKQGLMDIGKITDRDLFLIGIALYWAEGSKQNKKNISQRTVFSNQDPQMLRLFSRWLDVIGVTKINREYELYIHKHYLPFEKKIKKFWEEKLDNYLGNWKRTVIKKNDSDKKITKDYHGLLRISVVKSADLNRKIMGWIYAINCLT